MLELESTVVVPESVEPSKLAALETLEVKVVKYGASYDTAERHALKLASKDGRFISPYNDRLVVAGQGTVAVELLKRIEGALTVVCPVGGGGLLGGVALWATQRAGLRVIGVAVMHEEGKLSKAERVVSTLAGVFLDDLRQWFSETVY